MVEALRGARALGMRTLALTGRSGSAAAAAAEAAVVVDVAAPVPSPGIRTFQASLVSLFILAGRMAGIRGVGDDRGHREWCQEIVATGRALRATVEAAAAAARAVAEETARAPVSMMLASGRHLGIARYAAAKRIEASGLFAAAQDLEEWWHVERFAYPADMPVTIIAPPGATVALAAETALKARGLGRRVVAVCAEDTAGIRAHAHTILPIAASVREALSPLVSHPALTLVAAHEALILGRRPFQRDHPEFRERLQAYQAAFPDGS